MALIDRLNLIQDGEALDGVGDNPDVLNRTIKQLVTILEAGDQNSISIQNTNIKVESTDFEASVVSGDLVYLNPSDTKYTKINYEDAKYFIGIANLTLNTIQTSGIYEFTNKTLTPGKIMYLSTTTDGDIVDEDSEDKSDFMVGYAISSTEVLFFSGIVKDFDTLPKDIVTLTGSETLTNKVLTDFTNSILANYVHIKVSNRESSTLTAGTLVSLQGWDTGLEVPRIVPSISSVSTNPCIGILTQDIAPNATGELQINGIVDFLDTNSYSENEVLYVGDTLGTFTSTKPQVNAQVIGRVVQSSSTEGKVLLTLGMMNETDIDITDYITDYVTEAVQLSGVSSANENTTITITRDNYDSEIVYTPVVTGGSIVDNGATIDWTLPNVESDTIYYISDYARRVGELQSNLTTFEVTVLYVPVAPPTLSGVSSANELSTIDITITNYDAGAISYNISVGAGSYIRTDDVISWTLPEVTVDTSYNIVVGVTTSEGTSDNVTKSVTVLNVPIEGDDAVSVTTYTTIVDYNNGFDYI